MNTDVVLCDCSSPEHQILIHTNPDWDEPGEEREAYISIYLGTYRGFWGRLKYAWKYLWGYKSKYGAFDQMILTKKHVPAFEKLISYLKEEEK